MITEEQRLNRRKGIGGSDAAAVLGISKYKTPVDLYFEKVYGSEKEETEEEKKRKERGNRLEKFLISNYYKSFTPSEETLFFKEYPFIFANIDARHEEDLLEIKTVNKFRKKEFGTWKKYNIAGFKISSYLPGEILCQMYHYLAVTKCPMVVVGVFFGEEEAFETLVEMLDNNEEKEAVRFAETAIRSRVFFIDENFDLQNAILKEEINFWENHVLKKIPPEPINDSDLKKLYPLATKEGIEADSYIKEVYEDIKKSKSAIKKAKELLEEEEFRLKEYIEDYKEVFVRSDGKCEALYSYKNQFYKTPFNAEKFKKDHPEIDLSPYYEEKTHRVLRIK